MSYQNESNIVGGLNAACGQSQDQGLSGHRRSYGNMRSPLRDSMIVWVLETQGGYVEYLATDNLPDDKAHRVIARVGPFAWERGQGIDHNLRHLLNAAAADHRRNMDAQEQDKALQARIERAVKEQLTVRDPSLAGQVAYASECEPNEVPHAAYSGAQTAQPVMGLERPECVR